MPEKIKVVGFDADDTLWINEPHYRNVESEFCRIMQPYLTEPEASKELFKIEMQNLELYGYGAKGFMLSMIETAIRTTQGKISALEINQIIDAGKRLLTIPIALLEGVEPTLQQLQQKYKLILATKGDLLDQEQKLQRSGLARFFHHIEIMSEKHEDNYRKLLSHLDIEPWEFLMVGNSIRSDILPVLNIGAHAIHIPFDVMWQHEQNHESTENHNFPEVSKISEILELL